MEFDNLEEIKSQFVKGSFEFPQSFNVAGITYKRRSSSSHSMEEMVLDGLKGVLVYATSDTALRQHQEEVNNVGLNNWIVFLWSATPKDTLIPYDVRTMNVARGSMPIREAGEPNDAFIGSTVEVRFTNLPGGSALKGKVDTGADVCSLHSSEWKVNNGSVSFKCSELSPNVITVPLVDQQAVKSSDGGVEYRPVIELNIRINGKLLNGVLFNLNDRGKMEFPILIGRNALQAGKFKIDPSMDESADDGIDWKYIQEQVKDDAVPVDNELYTKLKSIADALQDLIPKE